MKISLKILLPVLVLLMTGSCATGRIGNGTKAEIKPLSADVVFEEGTVVYGLPMTVFDISIETERTVQKPGPYAGYAEDLLGLKDVIKSESEHWAVKGIFIKTHEELDPSEFYVIETSAILTTNALNLKKAGLILDLNPAIYDREATATGLYKKEAGLQHVYDLGSDEYFESRNDTVYRLVNADTAFIRIPYLVEKKQKLSIDQLAEKAATRLMELRDGKHMILTGEANVFPQNDAAINEINRLERDYLELFSGKTWNEKRTFTYQVIPLKDLAGKQVTICGFSENSGPVKAAGKDIIPLQIEFIEEHKTKALTLLANQQKQLSNRLYYRIPEVVNARISFGNEIISASRKLVYQLGDVVQLPSNYIIAK